MKPGRRTDGEGEESEDMEHKLPIPLWTKARCAPVPLDFKHPLLMNTVPGGLFKALANRGSGSSNSHNVSAAKESKEHTNRIMCSRLGSHGIFEHVSRPSLDDLCILTTSQNASQGRLFMDPGWWDAPPLLQEPHQPVRDHMHPFLRWPVPIPCPQICRAPHRIFHAASSYSNTVWGTASGASWAHSR
jgi:hypothetical protein